MRPPLHGSRSVDAGLNALTLDEGPRTRRQRVCSGNVLAPPPLPVNVVFVFLLLLLLLLLLAPLLVLHPVQIMQAPTFPVKAVENAVEVVARYQAPNSQRKATSLKASRIPRAQTRKPIAVSEGVEGAMKRLIYLSSSPSHAIDDYRR